MGRYIDRHTIRDRDRVTDRETQAERADNISSCTEGACVYDRSLNDSAGSGVSAWFPCYKHTLITRSHPAVLIAQTEPNKICRHCKLTLP